MAHAYLSTTDVAYFNDTDMDLVIRDVLNDAPLLSVLAARPVPGNDFVYTRLTAAPSVGFRAVNDGIENVKATREKVTVSLAYIDASIAVDIAAARTDTRGVEHLMREEATEALKQAMFVIEKAILQGTVTGGGGASTYFSGFASQSNLNGASDTMVVNAGGSSAGTGSSCYLLRTGEDGVEVLWGQQGMITIGERFIAQRDGSSTGVFNAYAHDISGWCGVKIASTYSVARIANLTEDSGKGLTDDLIAQAIAKFPASKGPNLMVMNRRSLRQLQDSRTATNPTGAPAPFPSEAFGIPIIVTDAIISTETLLS